MASRAVIKYTLFLVVLLFHGISSCFAGEVSHGVRLLYAGVPFLIPGGMTAIGVTEGGPGMLGLRYGKRLVAFSRLDDKGGGVGDCSEADLAGILLQGPDDADVEGPCVKEGRRFADALTADAREQGRWQIGTFSAYFIIAREDWDISHLFLSDGRKIVQIDSDFLDATGFRHLLSLVAESDTGEAAFPPIDLIAGNLSATDLTLAVRVLAVNREETLKSDNGEEGYARFRITARVLRVYRGAADRGSRLTYRSTVESGITPVQPGSEQIISLVRKGDALVIPDVGYAFPYSTGLDQLYQSAAGRVK